MPNLHPIPHFACYFTCLFFPLNSFITLISSLLKGVPSWRRISWNQRAGSFTFGSGVSQANMVFVFPLTNPQLMAAQPTLFCIPCIGLLYRPALRGCLRKQLHHYKTKQQGALNAFIPEHNYFLLVVPFSCAGNNCTMNTQISSNTFLFI